MDASYGGIDWSCTKPRKWFRGRFSILYFFGRQFERIYRGIACVLVKLSRPLKLRDRYASPSVSIASGQSVFAIFGIFPLLSSSSSSHQAAIVCLSSVNDQRTMGIRSRSTHTHTLNVYGICLTRLRLVTINTLEQPTLTLKARFRFICSWHMACHAMYNTNVCHFTRQRTAACDQIKG